MGSFKTSEGERLSKTTIDGLIRKAKAEADRIAESNEMIGFCWECGIPTSRPDHSHIVSVNECQNSGKAEQAYNPDNIELLCRNCHLEYESTKKIQNLQNLQITNRSYEEVIIAGENPVIYCDIPYKGTREYKEGGFDHEKFYQWAREIDYPVYISEYSAPFKEVYKVKHRSSLSATNNKKKTIESLYWNEKGVFNEINLF